uniref:Uncharacterized protein n=1 Tax=Anguilla anguilla TaxID=7936 RepID=A0A0E9XMU5_ANGAN
MTYNIPVLLNRIILHINNSNCLNNKARTDIFSAQHLQT